MDNKDSSIKLLRVIATLLVLIGHSNFYTIVTSIKGMGYDVSMYITDNSKFWHFSSYLVGLIYTCHMQLFFVISGYVFLLCLKIGKYKDFFRFIKRKFHRLVSPYLVVTVCYNIPILFFSGYFSDKIKNVCLYFVGYGKNHLWYLIALFFVFLIIYSFRLFFVKYDFVTERIMLLLMFLVSFILYFQIEFGIVSFVEFMYIDRIAKYLVWFILGMILYEIKSSSRIKFFNSSLSWGVVVFLFVLWISVYLKFHNNFSTIATSFVGVMFFYSFSECIVTNSNFFENIPIIRIIDKYSLDIYLYGVPLNYLILTMIIRIIGKVDLNSEQSFLLFTSRFFIQLIGGIGIGILIENVSKNIKKRNYLY